MDLNGYGTELNEFEQIRRTSNGIKRKQTDG